MTTTNEHISRDNYNRINAALHTITATIADIDMARILYPNTRTVANPAETEHADEYTRLMLNKPAESTLRYITALKAQSELMRIALNNNFVIGAEYDALHAAHNDAKLMYQYVKHNIGADVRSILAFETTAATSDGAVDTTADNATATDVPQPVSLVTLEQLTGTRSVDAHNEVQALRDRCEKAAIDIALHAVPTLQRLND